MGVQLGKSHCYLGLIFIFCAAPSLFAARIELKNGVTLEGDIARIGTLVANPRDAAGPAEEGKSIVLLDDNLRRVYIPFHQIREVADDAGRTETKFDISQPVAQGGRSLVSLGKILNRGKSEYQWDNYGRRTIEIRTKTGPVDVIQGITLVTPRYYRVQTLRSGRRLLLDQRFATSNLSGEYLRNLLKNSIDNKNSDRRIDIYQLFLEAERYADAEIELEQIIQDFPDLDLGDQMIAARNLKANRGLREIKDRRDAGQHRLAKSVLDKFPHEDIAGGTLIEVREILNAYQEISKRIDHIRLALNRELRQVKDQRLAEKLKPMIDEITTELNSHTLVRLSAFIQLEADASLAPTEKLALALSGWLLGSEEATDNLPIAMSLYDVRNDARAYLRSEERGLREQLITQIRSQEGGQPQLLAKILAHMKPPLEVPELLNDTPGFYQLSIPAGDKHQDIPYLIQLPPEYDPLRRYPAIVTLHGAGSPGHQIDWWAGGVDAEGRRTGQAARHGYIVIAPAWTKARQSGYQFTGREHNAVLHCLRDACRHFSIDMDRIFLSGHSMGGDAAWDIGLSHPDQWAGVIPIAATADHEKYNYNTLYWRNAKTVPFYFVGGEIDSNKMAKNAYQFDRYLRHFGYDTTIVDFQGRGNESFQDEILKIFAWMKKHRRNFFPKLFSCETIRSFDNYFWWVEITTMPPALTADPEQWPPKRIRTLKVTGKIRTTDEKTHIRVSSGRAPTTIWLAPELVDFDKRLQISVSGFPEVRRATPDIGVMLEDARTRGDRMHPFWAKVEFVPKSASQRRKSN